MSPWPEVLKQHGVAVLGAPARLPVEADLARTEARLKVTLPESYRRFCTEVGPGRLGDLLELWVPWHARGFFDSPRDIRSRLSSLVDASGGARQSLPGKAIQLGYVLLGGPPAPRVISASSAELFWVPDEPTDGDECALYALDHRTPTGTPPRLVKLAQSFSALLLEGFVGKRLARLPFTRAPQAEQFALEFRPSELPAP
ncbi:SMI1/KNR4 family protein [Corallococcus sp. M34]|uniref:SMI1/KNR4 family protein n=1 Tax=Citreicoccus inhibens TaxID=2849499 RepID=UPI0011C3479A|nr:SMI1/KNR4 family protein [Citreicoccus inhibens]MBU8899852.1 SMI1/KNR4 family protein [Citreicoccus inhibens]